MMKSIYIYGASGHGLVVADIARACGYNDIIFIDDGENDYSSFDAIKEANHIPMALGIGSNVIRETLFDKVKKNGFEIPFLVHPSATLSPSVTIGIGSVVMPNVVVNAKVTIGEGVILNTSCVIEHECVIGSFVHLSPNVALAGSVQIGNFSHIGIGSNVVQGRIIGNHTLIGAGSVVVKDIGSFKKAYGNPCKVVEDVQLGK
jgi:UDP-N-acetylbacillosamine N-acetyltransferase